MSKIYSKSYTDLMSDVKETHKITLHEPAKKLFCAPASNEHNTDEIGEKELIKIFEGHMSVPSFVINMRENSIFEHKNITSFKVSINLDQKLLNNVSFKLRIGSTEIYNNQFSKTNEIVPDGGIILNSMLCYHDVICVLYDIDELLPFIDNLVFSIDVSYVDLVQENRWCQMAHEFIIHKEDKINILRFMSGMAGNMFDEFITKERLDEYVKERTINKNY